MVALVLLPGMDGTGELFDEFLSSLGDALRPIVVAYPKDHPLDYDALTAFSQAYLPQNEPFVLLGESFSGPVAISLAATKPAGLRGLILCCSFDRNPFPIFRRLSSIIGLMPTTNKLIRLLGPLLFGRFSNPRLTASLRHALDGLSATTLRARLKAVLEADFSEKLKQVDVPILYLQATEDRIVPQSVLHKVLAGAPTAEVVKLRGPHLLLQTLPSDAAEAIRSFVQSSGRQRS